VSGGDHGLDQRYQYGFGNIDGRVRPIMSRDFVGTARLKLSPLCTLPFIALARIYEKILMRIDVTADRLYARPRLVKDTHELGLFISNS
jgi:hypothetical protein